MIVFLLLNAAYLFKSGNGHPHLPHQSFTNGTLNACENIADNSICNTVVKHYDVKYSLQGDLMLGGLFPVHLEACTMLEDMGTIQRLEAMPYAVAEINKKNKLKNLTMGYNIYDTCNQETVTLARTLSFLPACGQCSHYPICLPDCPVTHLGVVGPESSSNTLLAAHASTLALTSVISYFATSAELHNTLNYPTLHMTVPSDDYQVEAMLDVIQYFNWTYFSLVHSDDRYGKDATSYMQDSLRPGMCLAIIKQVSRLGTNCSYDETIEDLLRVGEYTNATVVIVFTDGLSANKLFEAVRRANAMDRFMWIGSEGWGISTNDIAEQLAVAQGAITFVPHTDFNTGFEEYFKSLNANHTENPWWREIWADYFGCSWEANSNKTSCYEYDHIDEENGYTSDSTVSLVIDAVDAFANALEHYLNDTYPDTNDLSTVEDLYISPWILSEYIRLEPFPGDSQPPNEHNSIADPISAVYDIRNLQKLADGTFDYVQVGDWTSNPTQNFHMDTTGNLAIQEDKIQWPIVHGDTAPASFCSAPCEFGMVKIFISSSCCWDCAECTANSIITDNQTRCQACPSMYWPDEARTECLEIEPTSIQWNSPSAITVLILAFVNLVMIKFCSVFFFKHKMDPLIKASGLEMMYVILFGLVLQNILVYVLLAEPSIETCSISRLVFGLDFTIAYSPVLLKSNRLYRVFHAARYSVMPPRWIMPKHQLIIVSIIISIQVIITVALAIAYPPNVVLYQPDIYNDVVELTCAQYDITILVPLSYNILIAIACLYYSWKTRILPNNYKESRFIVMAVCSFLMLWISFIPTYLIICSANGASSIVGVLMLATVEIISTVITLIALFFPRIYAVKFVPAKSWHVFDPSFTDDDVKVPKIIKNKVANFGGNANAKDITKKTSF